MSMDDALALFQRFDVNGNGTLGFDELRELLLIIGVPAADVPRLFGVIDTNSDGNIDFEEFIRWMYAQPVDAKEKMLGSTAVAKQLLREIADSLIAKNIPPEHLFASASVRSDGLLSRDELSRILLAYLPDLSPTVLSEAFHLCDWDHSGWINIEEFVSALRREASGLQELTPSTADVSVTVPAGWRYGMQLPVEYAGHLYHVDVPSGHTIGSTFTTTLKLPG
ncbi:unnamed protein product [Durusdinium trenchii]|uniref:EF-hand domain-containing protein n=2 Tax=Durusdinium trenchii TaxID=1381693 RepID=A0ABP0NIG0_9DINO